MSYYARSGKCLGPSFAVVNGVRRCGPVGSWWAVVTPRCRNGIGINLEVPAGRALAWNVATVAFLTGDLYVAHWFGVLGWVLAGIAGLVAVTAVGLGVIGRRNAPIPTRYGAPSSEEGAEHARVFAFLAARRAERNKVAA